MSRDSSIVDAVSAKLLQMNLDAGSRMPAVRDLTTMRSVVAQKQAADGREIVALCEVPSCRQGRLLLNQLAPTFDGVVQKMDYQTDNSVTLVNKERWSIDHEIGSTLGKYQAVVLTSTKDTSSLLHVNVHLPRGKKEKKRSCFRLLGNLLDDYKNETDGFIIEGDFNAKADYIWDHLGASGICLMHDGDATTLAGHSTDNVIIGNDMRFVDTEIEASSNAFSHHPLLATTSGGAKVGARKKRAAREKRNQSSHTRAGPAYGPTCGSGLDMRAPENVDFVEFVCKQSDRWLRIHGFGDAPTRGKRRNVDDSLPRTKNNDKFRKYIKENTPRLYC